MGKIRRSVYLLQKLYAPYTYIWSVYYTPKISSNYVEFNNDITISVKRRSMYNYKFIIYNNFYILNVFTFSGYSVIYKFSISTIMGFENTHIKFEDPLNIIWENKYMN